MKKIIAKDSMTGEFEKEFESMDALRKEWPSAEIVSTEEQEDCIVVYC